METAAEVQEQHTLFFLTELPKAQVEKSGVLSQSPYQQSTWLLGKDLTKLQEDQIVLPVVKTN